MKTIAKIVGFLLVLVYGCVLVQGAGFPAVGGIVLGGALVVA